MPKARPQLTCLALLLCFGAALMLCLGIGGMIWASKETWWQWPALAAFSLVVFAGGVAAMYGQSDAEKYSGKNRWLLDVAQFPLSGLTVSGWLLLLSTLAVFILSIPISVHLAEMLQMDDASGERLAGVLGLTFTGAYFGVGKKLLNRFGLTVRTG